MNPIFNLKNFRSYGEDGADFELAPITILTGCNSAGKSSLVKAQLLLEKTLHEVINREDSPENINLQISNLELALGNYKKILNRNTTTGTINFSYTLHSKLLDEDIKVTLTFVENKNDVVGNGILSALQIEKTNGEIIIQKKGLDNPRRGLNKKDIWREGDYRDYDVIYDNFIRFVVFCQYESALSEDEYCREFGYEGENAAEKEELAKQHYQYALDLCKQYHITREVANDYRSTKRLNICPKDFNTTNQWISNRSIFSYLPIFDETNGKEKSHLRIYLTNKVNLHNWGNEEAQLDWVGFFSEGFEKSSYSSFLDYFLSLEHEAMKKGFPGSSNGWLELHVVSGPVLDWGENTEAEHTKEDPDLNRITRKKYDDGWSFMNMVYALENICFEGEPYLLDYFPDYKAQLVPQNRFGKKTALEDFFSAMCIEALSPSYFEKVKYVNSTSVEVKRLYSTEDESKMGRSLKSYLSGNHQKLIYTTENDEIRSALNNRYEPGTFLNNWINKLKIGKEISVQGTDEGLGVLVYLKKENEEYSLLSDEGYGITQLVALLLQIENSILNATRQAISVAGFGQGPLQYEPTTIYLEEPEVHLHPKFQSRLAEMFVEAYREYNIRFIVETHSEYLIRKLQVMVADKENELTSNDVSLNYVDKDENGISHNRQIKILEDGRLSEPFGSGFYDEADDLAMELMKYKARRQ